jgi:hypothetical protein
MYTINMKPKVSKYIVPVNPKHKGGKGTFFVNAKKNIIKASSSTPQNLSQKVDNVVYGI